MAETTLTFELGGQVDIQALADGVSTLHQLVTALTPKAAGIAWVVEDLHAGSAVATLRGEADDLAEVEKIVAKFNDLGGALSRHEDLTMRYSREVQDAARAVTSLTNEVEYVRFESAYAEHIIHGNGTTPSKLAPLVSIGVITGTIQTLSNRSGLKFTIYDSVHDRGVTCYLEPGQEDLIREAWGRRASVSGTVYRNGAIGLPISVKNILKIDTLPDPVPGAWRNARGALPWEPGDKAAEDVIRESRDAWP